MKRVLNSTIALALALALQSLASASWAADRDTLEVEPTANHIALDLSLGAQLRGGDYGV